jgi:hypothetical protein
MPDTNPVCRTAFRSNSEIVRHPSGTLSGITPECCPPSVRNRVRHGAERAETTRMPSLKSRLTQLARLGGYLNHTGDGPPGNIVMRRGMSRLTDIELGFQMAMENVGN